MSLTSPIFLFVFLPISLAIYAFIPVLARKHTLAALCVAFYLVANIKNPFAPVLLAMTVLAVYFTARLIERQRGKHRMAVTAVAVAVIAAVFIILRAADPFGINFLSVEYPFGASVWLLSAISCLIDVKRGDAPPPTVADAVIYISYFPVMAAGPILKYRDSLGLFDHPNVKFDGIARGAEYFMLGFIKRFAVAAVLGDMLDLMWANLSVGVGVVSAIEYVIIVPFAVYAYFSGYSDMGTGISLMYGVELPSNFDRPLTSVSPLDYMRRFMSTLYSFGQDYIAHAIIGKSERKARRFFAYFAVFEFFIFWFSSDAFAAIMLLPLALCSALVAATVKERVRPLSIRIISGVLVFVLSSAFWGILLARSAPAALIAAGTIFENFNNPTSLLLLSGASVQKYLITVLTAGVTFAVLDRTVRAPSTETEHGAWHITADILMLMMFAASIFFYYPQFP